MPTKVAQPILSRFANLCVAYQLATEITEDTEELLEAHVTPHTTSHQDAAIEFRRSIDSGLQITANRYRFNTGDGLYFLELPERHSTPQFGAICDKRNLRLLLCDLCGKKKLDSK